METLGSKGPANASIQNISSVLKDLPSPPWYAERAANRPHWPPAGWWSFLAWCRRPKAEPLAALGTHAAKVRITRRGAWHNLDPRWSRGDARRRRVACP